MPIVPKEIELGCDVSIGGFNTFFLIAGPCVIENAEHSLFMAGEIKKICDDLAIPFLFKSSFDKANRSSLKSYRGPGLDAGLKILADIKKELYIPVLADIHESSQVDSAAAVLDVIQIPAFLCRQTDLLLAAAQTQKPINIKKGQFMAPQDIQNVVDKVLSQGNENIILTERGTTFGYNNLVFDIRSIPIMKKMGFPVCIDVSHSVQKPGGQGTVSGGEAEFIPHMARAGISVGADGVFVETHDRPEKALSDSSNSLKLKELHGLLEDLSKLRKALISHKK